MILKTGNSTSSKSSFLNGVAYAVFIKSALSRNYYFDFNNEDYGYGRRDSNGVTSFIDETRLRNIPASREIMALDFVASAWSQCKKEIDGYTVSRKISSSSFLNNLVPVVGYVSPHESHYSNVPKNILYYASNLEGCNYTMETFAKEVLSMVETRGELITKTAYIGSVRNSVRSTGLCLEFSRENFSNDAKKDLAYFQSDNFTFYCKILRKHGFRVDVNAPWRVVYDIYSNEGKKRIDGPYLLNAYKYDLQFLSVMIPYFFKAYLASKKKDVPQDLVLEGHSLLMYYARVRCAEAKLDPRKTKNVLASVVGVKDPLLFIDKSTNVIGSN